MADERIKLELDLTQSTASAKEFTASLQTVSVVADQNTVPSLQRVDVATNQVATSTNRLGSTVLYASYAVQDFTSQLGTRGLGGAFAAIQNNIPQILMGLGIGGGMTGVVSVLAVGVGVLYTNWDKVATLWGQGKTDEETARLKKMEEQIKATTAATEKLFNTQPPFQKEMGGRIDKAGAEFGGAKLEQELIRMYKAQFGDFGEDTGQLVRNLVTGARGGDRQSITNIENMANPDNSDVARRLTGRRTAREDAEIANRVRVREARQQFEAQEARDRFVKESMERAMREDAGTSRATQEKRRREAHDLGNLAAKQTEDERRDVGRGLAGTARDEIQLRRQIVQLQEQIGRMHDLETKGMASHMETQNIVHGMQAQMAQLQAQARQVAANNARLQQRQTVLDRGR